jgi:succinoglycan biosynthesis transport protein ExoP
LEVDRLTTSNGIDDEGGLDLRRYIRVLLERRWWFVGTVVFSLLVAAAHIAWQTPVYEAQATLLVDTGSPYSYRRQEDVLEAVADIRRLRTLDTQIQIIKTRNRLEGAGRLVAAQQLVAAVYGPGVAASDDPVHTDDRGNPGTARQFVPLLPEIESSIVPVLRQLKSAGVPAEWAEALLISDAQPEEVRSDGYPPDIERVETEALRAEQLASLAKLARRWVPFLARKYKARTSVHGIGGTDVLAIACRSTKPELAAAYANAVAQEHVWRSLISNQEAAKKGAAWLDERRNEAQGELQDKQEQLTRLLQESGLASVSEAATSLTERVASLSDTVANLRAATNADSAEIASLSGQLSEQQNTVVTTTETTTSPAMAELRAQLMALERDRAQLLDKVTEAHPSLAELDAQIARTRQQIADEVGNAISSETRVENPLGQQLLQQLAESQVRLVGDQARLAATEAALAEAQAELSRVPDVEQQAALLQRDVQLAEESYLNLLDRWRQLHLAQVAEVAGAEVLDYARVPIGHVYPNRRLTMLMALLAGLVLGFALTLVVDHLDNTVKDPAELEQLYGLPVLAIVPRVRRYESVEHLRALASGEERVVSEAYRSLRSNLRFSMPDLDMKCLLVTSPGVGEGKTTTCLNLSLAFGELGEEVVLVDTDLRRPRIAEILGLTNEVGLTTSAIGAQELSSALQATPYDNVRALTSGPVPPNPPRVLESEGMKKLLAELRQTSAFIVLDSPPAALLSDAQALAPLADGFVLVVEFGKTRRPLVERALELLQRTGTPCLGIVMNKAVVRRGGYGYYYYYYGGYYPYEEAPQGEQGDGAQR